MKALPQNLLSANDLETLDKIVLGIFENLPKIKQMKDVYPYSKLLQLIESFSRDLTERLFKILSEYHLMTISQKDFDELRVQYTKIFDTFDEKFK